MAITKPLNFNSARNASEDKLKSAFEPSITEPSCVSLKLATTKVCYKIAININENLYALHQTLMKIRSKTNTSFIPMLG